MRYIHLYTLFLMFGFCTFCKGQNQADLPKDSIKSEIKKVTSLYGPNCMTRAIRQDRNGNLWIATWDGIFRYDGKSFTNITSKVSSGRFFSVLEDRKGNFWFGSVGEGVYYYDGNSFQHYTTKDGLASNTALHLYEDKTGNIWFAGDEVSWYDGKSFQHFTTREGLCNNGTRWILQDKKGKFWIGTKDNACVFDGKTFTTFTNKDGKAFKNVWCIIEDKNGDIWLGGDDGLWRYDGLTFTSITKKHVISIIEDKKGNIWTAGTDLANQNWEVCRYEEKSLYHNMPTVTVIKSGVIPFLGVFEAHDGRIWISTGRGASCYDGKTFNDFKGEDGLK